MSLFGLVTRKEAEKIAKDAADEAISNFESRLNIYRGLYVPRSKYGSDGGEWLKVAFRPGKNEITIYDLIDYLGLEKVTQPEKTYLRKKK